MQIFINKSCQFIHRPPNPQHIANLNVFHIDLMIDTGTIIMEKLGKANPSINVLNKMVKPIGFVVTLSERVTHE